MKPLHKLTVTDIGRTEGRKKPLIGAQAIILPKNRIHSVNIPYVPNNNRIFQRVRNINEASTLKAILNSSILQPEKFLFLTSRWTHIAQISSYDPM